jgi:hypothetical protein
MRRWLIVGCLAACGCSTAPLADFMDCVFPAKTGGGGASPVKGPRVVPAPGDPLVESVPPGAVPPTRLLPPENPAPLAPATPAPTPPAAPGSPPLDPVPSARVGSSPVSRFGEIEAQPR